MDITSDRIVALNDLPAKEREALCRAYYREVYVPAFPSPSQREPLELICAAPEPPPDSAKPLLDLLVALDVFGSVIGGVHGEYYHRAPAALVSYLAVRPGTRRRGLGRRLFDVALARLQARAAADLDRPLPVFGECNDPERVAEAEDPMDARLRLRVLHRLGMRRLDMSYVQPPLAPGQPADHGLMLLIHRSSLAGDESGYSTAPVLAFLRSFYEAEGFTPAEDSPDFMAMRDTLAYRSRIAVAPLITA